jgi:hypothetical protein
MIELCASRKAVWGLKSQSPETRSAPLQQSAPNPNCLIVKDPTQFQKRPNGMADQERISMCTSELSTTRKESLSAQRPVPEKVLTGRKQTRPPLWLQKLALLRQTNHLAS